MANTGLWCLQTGQHGFETSVYDEPLEGGGKARGTYAVHIKQNLTASGSDDYVNHISEGLRMRPHIHTCPYIPVKPIHVYTFSSFTVQATAGGAQLVVLTLLF